MLAGAPPSSGAFGELLAQARATHACAWVTWPTPDGIAPRHDAARAEFTADTGLACESTAGVESKTPDVGDFDARDGAMKQLAAHAKGLTALASAQQSQ